MTDKRVLELETENARLREEAEEYRQMGMEEVERGLKLEEEVKALREELTKHHDESISARCFRTRCQCRHICERLDCCDNTSEWAKKYKALRAVVEAAHEHIKTLHDTEQILNAEELAIEAALAKVDADK